MRELEEDMELGAEGDLNAAAPSTAIFPLPLSLSLSRRGYRRALCRRGHRRSLSPTYIAHPQRLSTQRLIAGSHKPREQRSDRVARFCRLIPPVRAESKH